MKFTIREREGKPTENGAHSTPRTEKYKRMIHTLLKKKGSRSYKGRGQTKRAFRRNFQPRKGEGLKKGGTIVKEGGDPVPHSHLSSKESKQGRDALAIRKKRVRGKNEASPRRLVC